MDPQQWRAGARRASARPATHPPRRRLRDPARRRGPPSPAPGGGASARSSARDKAAVFMRRRGWRRGGAIVDGSCADARGGEEGGEKGGLAEGAGQRARRARARGRVERDACDERQFVVARRHVARLRALEPPACGTNRCLRRDAAATLSTEPGGREKDAVQITGVEL